MRKTTYSLFLSDDSVTFEMGARNLNFRLSLGTPNPSLRSGAALYEELSGLT